MVPKRAASASPDAIRRDARGGAVPFRRDGRRIREEPVPAERTAVKAGPLAFPGMAAVKAKAQPKAAVPWIEVPMVPRAAAVEFRSGAGIVCRPMEDDWDTWAHVGLTEDMKTTISELIKEDMMRGLVSSYGYSEEFMVITYNENEFINVKWEKRESYCTDTLLVYKIIDLFTDTVSDWA